MASSKTPAPPSEGRPSHVHTRGLARSVHGASVYAGISYTTPMAVEEPAEPAQACLEQLLASFSGDQKISDLRAVLELVTGIVTYQDDNGHGHDKFSAKLQLLCANLDSQRLAWFHHNKGHVFVPLGLATPSKTNARSVTVEWEASRRPFFCELASLLRGAIAAIDEERPLRCCGCKMTAELLSRWRKKFGSSPPVDELIVFDLYIDCMLRVGSDGVVVGYAYSRECGGQRTCTRGNPTCDTCAKVLTEHHVRPSDLRRLYDRSANLGKLQNAILDGDDYALDSFDLRRIVANLEHDAKELRQAEQHRSKLKLTLKQMRARLATAEFMRDSISGHCACRH
jgi:hypothetical protein